MPSRKFQDLDNRTINGSQIQSVCERSNGEIEVQTVNGSHYSFANLSYLYPTLDPLIKANFLNR